MTRRRPSAASQRWNAWPAHAKDEGTRGQLVGRGVIGGANTELPITSPPTLAEQGLDKKTSSIAQQLADLPEEEVEAIKIEKAEAHGGKICLPIAGKSKAEAQVAELERRVVELERLARK